MPITLHFQLATGCLGRVYFVTDATTGRHWAFKTVAATDDILNSELLLEQNIGAALASVEASRKDGVGCARKTIFSPEHNLLCMFIEYIPHSFRDLIKAVGRIRGTVPAESGDENDDATIAADDDDDDDDETTVDGGGVEEHSDEVGSEDDKLPSQMPDHSLLTFLQLPDDASVDEWPTFSVSDFKLAPAADQVARVTRQSLAQTNEQRLHSFLDGGVWHIRDDAEWNRFLRSLMTSMARALDQIHSRLFVVGDPKSSNDGFCIDPESGALQVKVLDFGIAKRSCRAFNMQLLCSCEYSPPEIFLKDRVIAPQAIDMWAMGVSIASIVRGDRILDMELMSDSEDEADDDDAEEEADEVDAIQETESDTDGETDDDDENLQDELLALLEDQRIQDTALASSTSEAPSCPLSVAAAPDSADGGHGDMTGREVRFLLRNWLALGLYTPRKDLAEASVLSLLPAEGGDTTDGWMSFDTLGVYEERLRQLPGMRELDDVNFRALQCLLLRDPRQRITSHQLLKHLTHDEAGRFDYVPPTEAQQSLVLTNREPHTLVTAAGEWDREYFAGNDTIFRALAGDGLPGVSATGFASAIGEGLRSYVHQFCDGTLNTRPASSQPVLLALEVFLRGVGERTVGAEPTSDELARCFKMCLVLATKVVLENNVDWDVPDPEWGERDARMLLDILAQVQGCVDGVTCHTALLAAVQRARDTEAAASSEDLRTSDGVWTDVLHVTGLLAQNWIVHTYGSKQPLDLDLLVDLAQRIVERGWDAVDLAPEFTVPPCLQSLAAATRRDEDDDDE